MSHAAEAKEATADDAASKADYLRAAERWMTMSHSYEFSDKVTDFMAARSDSLREPDKRAGADVAPDDALLLHEISTALIQEDDIDALYERILDGAIDLASADMGSLQMHDPTRNELRLLAWRGFHPESAAFWDRIQLGSAHASCGVSFLSGRRVIVPNADDCDFMAGSVDLAHYRLSGIRAVQSTPLVSRFGQIVGMVSTHWREPHQPSERALRSIDVLARQAADLIERTRNEIALRQLALIVESSDDAIVSKDLNGVITSWNKGAERIFGYSAEEVIGKPITILIPLDRQDEEPEILRRIRSGERVDHYETIRQCKNGRLIDVSLSVSPIRDMAGKIVGASKISRDITERKQAEAQIKLLAREAEHRAKNVLATVQATVHLSQADTPDGLKRAIEGRIQALANVHRLFVETRWTGAELHLMVTEELAGYRQGDDSRVYIDGPNLVMEPSAAQAVAVILHELATNAAKYGSLSVPGGHIHLNWSHADDGQIVLRWTETGGPSIKIPARQGFGTRVVDGMLRGLKGEIRRDWRPEGLSAEIVIPNSD
jgi:PAS domain S-box-containing protein